MGVKDLDGRIPSTLLSLYYHCDQLVVEKSASCTDRRPMVPLNVDQGVVHLWVCHTSPHLVPLLRQGFLNLTLKGERCEPECCCTFFTDYAVLSDTVIGDALDC